MRLWEDARTDLEQSLAARVDAPKSTACSKKSSADFSMTSMPKYTCAAAEALEQADKSLQGS
ncbi:MAG UNVERIFIED_CONTAM: hypothetical protein LVR18_49110 [Planctomycetaceae bacterium]|jgi:hypothetical protein